MHSSSELRNNWCRKLVSMPWHLPQCARATLPILLPQLSWIELSSGCCLGWQCSRYSAYKVVQERTDISRCTAVPKALRGCHCALRRCLCRLFSGPLFSFSVPLTLRGPWTCHAVWCRASREGVLSATRCAATNRPHMALNSISNSFIFSRTRSRSALDAFETDLSWDAVRAFLKVILDSASVPGETSERVMVPLNFFVFDAFVSTCREINDAWSGRCVNSWNIWQQASKSLIYLHLSSSHCPACFL